MLLGELHGWELLPNYVVHKESIYHINAMEMNTCFLVLNFMLVNPVGHVGNELACVAFPCKPEPLALQLGKGLVQ